MLFVVKILSCGSCKKLSKGMVDGKLNIVGKVIARSVVIERSRKDKP